MKKRNKESFITCVTSVFSDLDGHSQTERLRPSAEDLVNQIVAIMPNYDLQKHPRGLPKIDPIIFCN